ncbi:TPA: KilA-N domain-containing protein [Escherichia coli]|nr:KilA-N domain-containing protein [Escherichia coli]
MSTQPLMKHEVVLPVIVDGYHWACNQDRMWNLNELHKELELPSAKEPGQWRSSVRTLLDQDANLHVAHGGSTPGTWATEEVAIAYAMWVSPDFYLKVIRAFIALRNDKVSEAKALAQDSKELKGLKPILEKLDNPKQGHTLTECLKNLDFRLGTKLVSAKALNAVLKSGRIANPFYSRKLDGRGQPVFDISSGGWMTSFNPKGLENGYYRLQDNHYNGQEGLKVLTKGYEWLKSNKVELVRLCAKGDSKMIDPRTPEGRMTLRYRGYRTEVLLRELGLDPEDETRQHQSRDELIAQLVAMKLSA